MFLQVDWCIWQVDFTYMASLIVIKLKLHLIKSACQLIESTCHLGKCISQLFINNEMDKNAKRRFCIFYKTISFYYMTSIFN